MESGCAFGGATTVRSGCTIQLVSQSGSLRSDCGACAKTISIPADWTENDSCCSSSFPFPSTVAYSAPQSPEIGLFEPVVLALNFNGQRKLRSRSNDPRSIQVSGGKVGSRLSTRRCVSLGRPCSL